MRRAPYALVVMAAAALALAGVLLAGQGGSSPLSSSGCAVPARSAEAGPPPPGARSADPRQTAVVCAWAAAEARADYAGASALFALPSVIETPDAGGRISIEQLARPADIQDFNRGLTCAALPIRSLAVAAYTVVSFRLLTRPGGSPCAGIAHTAFLMRGGRIVAWLRAPDDLSRLRLPAPAPGGGAPSPSAPAPSPVPPGGIGAPDGSAPAV